MVKDKTQKGAGVKKSNFQHSNYAWPRACHSPLKTYEENGYILPFNILYTAL